MSLNHKEIASRLLKLNNRIVKIFGWASFAGESTAKTKCRFCEGCLRIKSDCIEIDSDVFSMDSIIDVNIENKEIEIGMSGEYQ